MEGKPFGGGWDGPQFVLTHHAPDTSVPGVTLIGGSDVKLERISLTRPERGKPLVPRDPLIGPPHP